MHQHQNEEGRDSLRPKGSRIDSDRGAHAGQAAAHGRADVLDPDSILGLQRSAGNGAVTSLMEEERSPVHDVVSSGGRPLEPEVRTITAAVSAGTSCREVQVGMPVASAG